MKYCLISCFFILTAFSLILAQENDVKLTGNLNVDSKIVLDSYKDNMVQQAPLSIGNKKSPVLAGLFSGIIPGAGEFYTEQYVKGGILLAIEAAAIYVGLKYNKLGDNRTTDFNNYADKNWSVVKYAQWLIQYQNAPGDIITSNDESKRPWERVDWTKLNAAEIGSHKLERYGEQQYYEMIGKYYQFAAGWDDFTFGNSIESRSPHNDLYEGMRHDANDAYNVAAKAVIVICVNHVLSIIDAIWSANVYNKHIAMNVRFQENQFAFRTEYVPTVNFSYSF